MSINYGDQGDDEQPVQSPTTVAGSSPLRNVEAFEAYCAEVQEKLAAHAVHRMSFLQAAFDRLTNLLQAARDVEDVNLANELAQHRIASRELLDAVRRATGITAIPAVSPAPSSTPIQRITSPVVSTPIIAASPAVVPAFNRPTPVPIVPSVSQLSRRAEPVAPTPVASSIVGEVTAASPAASRLPRRPMRPLIDIEADALSLRQEIKEWMKKYPLNTAEAELNIPNCLRLRSIACRHRRLEEECGDSEVAEVTELSEDIIDLLDSANDQEYTVALDDELDPRPTAYQWGELAERYMEMARAQEGFEWWQRNRNLLAVSDVQPLAEAVAAVQQRFNRLLFRIGARDPFQQQLFDDLRTWAREDQCYLYSLRPKVPMAELMEKAATLEDAWDRARGPVADEEYRQKLIDNVIALLSEPDFGEHGEHDEDVLRDSLWECKNHRVPAADKRLRAALASWSSFIEGDERFKDLLREIMSEWEARLEAGTLDEGAHEVVGDPPAAEVSAIRDVTRGKKLFVLGGSPTDTLRDRYKETLDLESIVWPAANPADPLSTFDDQLNAADIVILVSQYSRRDWRAAQDDCLKDGKKYAQVASMSDLPVLVRHLIKQLAPPVAGKKR